jgi:hypothetical protein
VLKDQIITQAGTVAKHSQEHEYVCKDQPFTNQHACEDDGHLDVPGRRPRDKSPRHVPLETNDEEMIITIRISRYKGTDGKTEACDEPG